MRPRLDIIHWPLWLSLTGIVFANVGFGEGAARITATLLFLLPLTLFAYLLLLYLFAPGESEPRAGARNRIAADRDRPTAL